MKNPFNMSLPEFYQILCKAGITVSHYEADLDKFPYIVYQELSTGHSNASGKNWREVTRVNVEHFTKKEWDPSLEKLKLALMENRINFTTTTNYFTDTKVINTVFDLTIARDMEA